MKITNVLAHDDRLSVTMNQNGKQFTVEFTGEISTTFSAHTTGSSVVFHCTFPRSGENPVKPLNRPPLSA